jgi:hypothetical protein
LILGQKSKRAKPIILGEKNLTGRKKGFVLASQEIDL